MCRFLLCTNLPATSKTVFYGHHHIGNNQIGKLFFRHAHTFLTIAGFIYRILGNKQAPNVFANIFIILYNQQTLFSSRFLCAVFRFQRKWFRFIILRRILLLAINHFVCIFCKMFFPVRNI